MHSWCLHLFWLPGANIKLSDERRLQMELEEEKPINLRLRKKWGCCYIFALTQSGFLCFISMGPAKSSIFNISIHPHSYSMSYMNMDISKQKRLKLPIQCFNLMFSIWQPFHPTSTNLSSVTNEHGLWIRPSCPQGHNLFGY